jgi:thioredoxin reductase (NADPH)
VGDDLRDLIIIGSGPAGYTAAVYAARANLRPLVFEGINAGGALMTTTDVENFPGFPDGILGPELMDGMRKQAERFGAELLPDDVTDVDLTGPEKVVRVDADVYRAKAVIVATGSQWRTLGLPDEQRLLGHGVSACATCDGFFFRGQQIAVVGGGDSAMEEATFLTKFAESVTIIHRKDTLRASAIMQERARTNPKIQFVWNSVVEQIEGDTAVTGVRLRDVVSGESSALPVTGLFVAIGHVPRTELFRGQLDMDADGYLRAQPPSHEPARRVRSRRRGRPRLPAGDHGRRDRVRGCSRRRALARRGRAGRDPDLRRLMQGVPPVGGRRREPRWGGVKEWV